MRRFIRTLTIMAGLVWCLGTVDAWAALSIADPFNFRENIGPNVLGIPPGDKLVIGADSITPSGPPTMVTASQDDTVVDVPFLPQMGLPNQYAVRLPFDPALTGSWTLTATRDSGVASAFTNDIPTPRLIPLVDNLIVLGAGPQPTLRWDLPDLTGLGVTRIRVRGLDVSNADTIFTITIWTSSSPAPIPTGFMIPAGLLQEGQTYVFRVMLDDRDPVSGIFLNRSSTFSNPITVSTVFATTGFTVFDDRATFEAQLTQKIVDDYSNPGYDVNGDPNLIDFLSNTQMSNVLGETDYVTTQILNNGNQVFGQSFDPGYCGGCNASFMLGFTRTSIGDSSGVFAVGFDVEDASPTDMFPEIPHAFVTFGDGKVATFPLGVDFWGIIAPQRIQSVHIGREDGGNTTAVNQIFITIDDLTIGSIAIQVAVDVKPGSADNPVNLHSHGMLPVAILSTPTFDATTVDAATLTVAGASVATRGRGALMASPEDVNGDGILDLVVHVRIQDLQLTAADTQVVVNGQTTGGVQFTGADTVRIVP